jgi:hypothetical protein
MTKQERHQYISDLELYLFLLDYYAKNREAAKSMNDRAYWEHIDAILDEINGIKKALAEDNDDISEQ